MVLLRMFSVVKNKCKALTNSICQWLKSNIGSIVKHVAIATCWVFVIFVFFIIGPITEGKYLPVVTNVSLTHIKQNEDHTEIVFEGVKVRTCEFVEVSAIVQNNGASNKGKIIFEDYDGSKSRAPGQQLFGPWKIYPNGNRITIVSYHRCHPLWQTVTPLLTWNSQ